MRKIPGWAFAGATLALAFFLIAFVFPTGKPPKLPPAGTYEKEMAQAGANVAMALLVVTLFVERSIAVLNSLLFGDRERKAEVARSNRATQAAGDAALADVLTDKERLRLLLSFGAGLFVSAAGVRTLSGLIKVTDNAFLFPVDVILTAGLIAGGSNALTFLIQVLKNLIKNPPSGRGQDLRNRLITTT